MTLYSIHSLQKFIQSYRKIIPELVDSKLQLEKILSQKSLEKLIEFYDTIYPVVEKELWAGDNFDETLENYQSLFREQESLLNHLSSETRYDFILSIPIADRPEHLRGCLESIFQLCSLYSYGGLSDGFFSKVMVVIVEDSKEKRHIEKDIELAEEYTKKGLRVHHYGLDEQYELMLSIPEELRCEVSSLIGEASNENFYHKGQAVTRNLSYLKALQLISDELEGAFDKDNTLFYFVDSDQQFRVNRITSDGDQYVYGLNYFYYINKLFSEKNMDMLTGKLVCDPPVSPSVMSGNFLDDIIAFFEQLANYQAKQECQFHPLSKIKPDDAAYHDMAHLFGLGSLRKTYDYCCSIEAAHDHNHCLKSFSDRINYFFFGEHLTRKTYFSYLGDFKNTVPARTIYPGNYIVTFDGLKYIIPFGQLRLRMSGPTAGRLIQSEIGERFASVNLPMLHARTLQSDFDDEYRPGVEEHKNYIDLSDEFERQFFGDLMLFSVVKLSKSGIQVEGCNYKLLSEIFSVVEEELLELYKEKHNNVLNKCKILSELVDNKNLWWNQDESLQESINQVRRFISTIEFNFNEHSYAYQQIQSRENRQERIEKMIASLLSYRKDRDAWDKMLFLISNSSV